MENTLTKNLPILIKELSKKEINALAEKITASVDSGDENSGELYIKLDFLEKALKMAKDAIKEGAIDELKKYDKGQTLGGVEFSVQEKGRYTYNHNQTWVDKKAELTAIESDMKAAAKSSNSILDESTGELIPAAKTSYSESITPKYPK
jgi:hypothetical protein